VKRRWFSEWRISTRALGAAVHLQDLRKRLLRDQDVREVAFASSFGKSIRASRWPSVATELELLALVLEERAHELEPGLLRRDGVQDLTGQSFPEIQRKRRPSWPRPSVPSEVLGRLRDEPEARALAGHPEVVVVHQLQRDVRLRQVADQVEELPRRNRHAPGSRNLRLGLGQQSQVEIGRREAQVPVGGLEEDVREDRNRVFSARRRPA
jgi:hypothetical protein